MKFKIYLLITKPKNYILVDKGDHMIPHFDYKRCCLINDGYHVETTFYVPREKLNLNTIEYLDFHDDKYEQPL